MRSGILSELALSKVEMLALSEDTSFQAYPIPFPKRQLKRQSQPVVDLRWDADVGQVEVSEHALEPDLGQGQGQRPLGMYHRPRRFTRRGVETRGDVQGEHPRRVLVAQLDQFGGPSLRRPVQAVSNQRVHDELRTTDHVFGLGRIHRLHTRRLKDLELIARGPAQYRRRSCWRRRSPARLPPATRRLP